MPSSASSMTLTRRRRRCSPLSGISTGAHAQLRAAEHLERVGDPRGHADLHRQQDLLRHADGLGRRDSLGGISQHRHGDDDRDLRALARAPRRPASTKTVNLGTGGASGSTTVVNIGSATAGAAGTTVVNTPDRDLRQCRHAGRHAAGEPNRPAARPRRGDGGQRQPALGQRPGASCSTTLGPGSRRRSTRPRPRTMPPSPSRLGFRRGPPDRPSGQRRLQLQGQPGWLGLLEAMRIDRTSGQVELPQPAILPGLSAAPSPPAAGKAAVYARNRAGAPWIDVMRPSGRDFPLQPHFGVNRIANWSPSVTTTITTEGPPITSVGTVFYPTLAATNLAASMRRWRLTSAATVDAAAEQRSAGWACWRGNAAGLGGWSFVTRISLTTIQATGMGSFGLYGFNAGARHHADAGHGHVQPAQVVKPELPGDVERHGEPADFAREPAGGPSVRSASASASSGGARSVPCR